MVLMLWFQKNVCGKLSAAIHDFSLWLTTVSNQVEINWVQSHTVKKRLKFQIFWQLTMSYLEALPELVYKNIVKYLDSKDKLNLRLSSRRLINHFILIFNYLGAFEFGVKSPPPPLTHTNTKRGGEGADVPLFETKIKTRMISD